MNAAKKIRKLLEQKPEDPSSRMLSRLVVAIGEESALPIADLYALNYESFGALLDLLKEWRLDRHYMSKLRLLDVALVHAEGEAPAGAVSGEKAASVPDRVP